MLRKSAFVIFLVPTTSAGVVSVSMGWDSVLVADDVVPGAADEALAGGR